VASVVDSGSWHAPSLVAGMSDPTSTARAAESPQVLSELRGLMRGAMRTSSNQVANVDGAVSGQSGSAPFGSGQQHIDWFVGYQGNVAFAVVELANSASQSASPLAGSFLQKLQAGS